MDFLHEHKMISGILYLLSFLASGYISFLFITSSADSEAEFVVGAIQTLSFELGKAIFSICSILPMFDIKTQKTFRVVWIVLTIFSIYFSVGYMINVTNRIENNLVNSSPELAQLKQKESRLNDSITTKKELLNKSLADKESNTATAQADKMEVSKKVDEYNKDIKAYQNQINNKNAEMKKSIGKGFTGQTTRLQTEITQLQDSINKTTIARDNLRVTDGSARDQENINNLNKEIDGLNQELNGINYNSIAVDPSKSEKGMLSISLMFANFLHVGAGTYILVFNILFNTIFEILINLFYKVSFIGRDHHSTTTQDKTKQSKPNWLKKISPEAVTARKIGFDTTSKESPQIHASYDVRGTQDLKPLEIGQSVFTSHASTDFDKSDILTYVNYMYTNKNGNESPGYQKIRAGTGLENEICRKIKGFLENMGIVKVCGSKTIILVEKEHCLKSCQL